MQFPHTGWVEVFSNIDAFAFPGIQAPTCESEVYVSHHGTALTFHSRSAQPQRRSFARYLRVQYVPRLVCFVELTGLDFEKPSAIQQRAIYPIMRGRDVIAQAQSGTGKTATFSISALQMLDVNIRETQALVLSPTRELAIQIQTVMLALGDYMNVSCHACIGGTSVGEDIRKLEAGQQVVSGTPGRVFDMIRRRNLRTKDIKVG